MLWRVLRVAAAAVQWSLVALVAVVVGTFWIGYERWVKAGDWRVMGAFLRTAGGLFFGWLIGALLHHWFDVEKEFICVMSAVGSVVGLLWGIAWAWMSPPPRPFRRGFPEVKQDEEAPPDEAA